MLAFDRPVPSAPGAYYDQEEPGRVHVIPDRLEPVSQDGRAEVTLLLHQAPSEAIGGVFQSRLRVGGGARALRRPTWQIADVAAARARITPRAPGVPDHLGHWHPALLDSSGAMFLHFPIASTEAQLMRRLALDGGDVLDVTVELDIPSVAAGLAAVAHLPGERLWDALDALLVQTEFDRLAFETAFLSLPDDMIGFKTIGRAMPAGRETLVRETAARALPILLDRLPPDGVQPLFRLTDRTQAGPVSISLALPLAELRPVRLAWSVSRFVEALEPDDIPRHFPAVHTIEPFSDVTIRVLNEVPLGSAQAMGLNVDVTCPGPGGTPESHRIRYRPGDPVAQEVRTRYPSVNTPFSVTSRAAALLSPGPAGGFPKRWPRDADFRDEEDPFTIRVTPDRLNLALVQLVALAGVFDHAETIRATFSHDGGETRAELTSGHSDDWVVLPGHAHGAAYQVRIEALTEPARGADPVLLRDGPEEDTALVISRFELIVRAPDHVTALLGERVRFAVIELSQPGLGTTTRALRPGDRTEIAVWRRDLFSSLAFDWRASVVRETDAGATLPMEHLDWVRGHGGDIVIH